MLNKRNIPILLFIFLLTFQSCQDSVDDFSLFSPDGNKSITFFSPSDFERLSFNIKNKGEKILEKSFLDLSAQELNFHGTWTILKTEKKEVNKEWHSNLNELSRIPDHYNELKLYLKQGDTELNIISRAYNEGIAFAYEIPGQNGLKEINLDENIHFNFKKDYELWATPKREKGVLTAQGKYRKIPLSTLEQGIDRPLLIEIHDSLKVALAEAKLVNYARMSFAKGTSSKYSIISSLDGKMSDVKQDAISGADINERQVKGTKVKLSLPSLSPWRVIMIGQNEAELLEHNYLIQNLNDPSEIKDPSWIIPGKVLRETTLTTQGGLAAIDFVHNHNMQYVLFDAGWYGNEMNNASDATTVTLDPKRSAGPFDIERIAKYAKEKNIGIILYVNRRALEKQLDEVLPLFKKWGIAGIKYGFVRVGDQDATAWLHDAVKKAADYQMILDVHDEYRPTGFSRTYPNLLTQEGIRGDEETVSNEHTLITMFTRMLAGAADNTVCYYNKRVLKMGSHASQLAKTVCIFSPLQFLYWYDKPASSPEKTDGLWGDSRHIGNEPELDFFDSVPTTWDETKVLQAEIGKIGVIARRKGKDWFIGGINGPEERSINLDFSFLEKGESYAAKIYTDDPTVNTRTKVKIQEIDLTNKSQMTLQVASNNGFAFHIKY